MNYHMPGNIVETHFLNEYAVAKLGKTDVKFKMSLSVRALIARHASLEITVF